MKALLNRTGIRTLLDKFYSGESTAEEEKLLQYFFHSDEVPEEFRAEQEIFRALYTARDSELPEESFSSILDSALATATPVRRLVPRKWLSVAAAALVMLGTGGVLFWKLNSQEKKLADTYTDPKLAYMEAKKALMKVSYNLNKGTSQLNNLSKFNTGMEKLPPAVFSTRQTIQ